MTDPQITQYDGTDMPISERFVAGLVYLRSTQPDPQHDELWKLLSLAVFRLDRLEACAHPTWSHVASPYLTLHTLQTHLQYVDYFRRIPRPTA